MLRKLHVTTPLGEEVNHVHSLPLTVALGDTPGAPNIDWKKLFGKVWPVEVLTVSTSKFTALIFCRLSE